ncbi:protein of unknown function [Actinopolyspora xinjiangensis]|uniref:DUF4395 domain-containing protein n=1 Tax=Actinopolyspora xinjiangensis TaxID=405564 RepID=A0A1H0VMP7_9ACTN|nr:DUF4395 domain-containing protein [Actinopolyspora xinjiangensis]SDP79869.1 protein of unknown function [Actinopolyspora xinjiangensis]
MPSDARIDPRGVRFTAWITSGILVVGLLTGSWRVLAAQTALFALCSFVGLRMNPWGHFYRHAVRPHLSDAPDRPYEDPAPVRFAQGIGFACTLVATVGYAGGWTALGVTTNALALVAALLNAAFGYCLGCRLYPLARRLVPVGPATRIR